MKLGAVIVGLLLRLLIALPLLVLMVGAALCAALIELLAPKPGSQTEPPDVTTSASFHQGAT